MKTLVICFDKSLTIDLTESYELFDGSQNGSYDKVIAWNCGPFIQRMYDANKALKDVCTKAKERIIIIKEPQKFIGDFVADRIVYPNEGKRIVITVPVLDGRLVPQCAKALFDLIRPDGFTVDLELISGYTVAQARENARKFALERHYDYQFMVDSDVQVPRDTLLKLLAADKDFICGWYPKKIASIGICPEIYEYHPENHDKKSVFEQIAKEPKEISKIGACGFGCVLIKTSLYEKIPEPFEYGEYSEDLGFCKLCCERGIDIWVEPSIRCGHWGMVCF